MEAARRASAAEAEAARRAAQAEAEAVRAVFATEEVLPPPASRALSLPE